MALFILANQMTNKQTLETLLTNITQQSAYWIYASQVSKFSDHFLISADFYHPELEVGILWVFCGGERKKEIDPFDPLSRIFIRVIIEVKFRTV